VNRDTRLLATHVIFVAVLIAVAPFAFAADAVPSEDREVRFNRDIRPILADKCFQCHGPDARMRKADLRLDKHDDEGAIRGGASVLLAGDIDESELIQRITSSDADERMPPPTATRHLTLNEIALLKLGSSGSEVRITLGVYLACSSPFSRSEEHWLAK
jgi:hypothetical protein